MSALIARDAGAAESAFLELLAGNASPLRIALLAERTVMRGGEGGAVLLLEQDATSGSLGESGKKVAELLEIGREQMNQADDGWYFASVGRFDIAQANFLALLDSKPDAVALLEFADRAPRRLELLVQLSDHAIMGEAARQMLRKLAQGEREIKADADRIKENIQRLAGPPRAYQNAADRLKESGEWAVPYVVQALRDTNQPQLVAPILRTLPTVGRAGLNPMVIGLRINDTTTVRYLVDALGQIGYWQGAPYLMVVRDDEHQPADVRSAASQALAGIASRGVDLSGLTKQEAFLKLADGYYKHDTVLAPDPRLEYANLWYWRDELLQNVPVPTEIFCEVMAMRCCEEALRFDAGNKPAIALWLAANFRREAQLPEGMSDDSRPPAFASARFYAQSAGPEYCLMTLARAVDGGNAAVALGAIDAMSSTAGPATILAGMPERHPLAEALSFPDRLVRIRAALTLANALPAQPFHNSQNLMPVLVEALKLRGGAKYALVVDHDQTSANAVVAALRSAGYEVVSDAGLFTGVDKVRNELPGVDVIFVGSDIANPDLAAGLSSLRSEFRFASTPVVIIAKPAQRGSVRELVRSDHRLGSIVVGDTPESILGVLGSVSRSAGVTPIAPELGKQLALEASAALSQLGESHNPLIKVADAEQALLAGVVGEDAELRLAMSETLTWCPTAGAQEALAAIALDEQRPEDLRLTMFALLAAAAQRSGNHLGGDATKALLAAAEAHENMQIRQAASQALGALNLPGNPASTMIRNQYAG